MFLFIKGSCNNIVNLKLVSMYLFAFISKIEFFLLCDKFIILILDIIDAYSVSQLI